MAWSGEIVDIDRPTSLEERPRQVIEGSAALSDRGRRPGYYCVRCDRAARCGAYPASEGGKAPPHARTLNLTKTDLIDLAVCQRRVAWRRVHAIPYDSGDDPAESDELSRGIEFHRLLSAAHASDDPARRRFPPRPTRLRSGRLPPDVGPPPEAARCRGADGAPHRVPGRNHLLEGEKQDLRGATVIGFLTARDALGDAAAIEVKTGTSVVSGVEKDLNPPECERFEYSASDLDQAISRLHERIAPALTWDWDDPLEAPYRVGAWCQGCRHEAICGLYR